MEVPLTVPQTENVVVQAVREYGRQLFRFIRGKVRSEEEAEDILQEVWVQFALLPEADALESASGWLYRVARNKIVDNFRKKKPEPLPENEPERLLEAVLAAGNSPEDEFFKAAFWEAMNSALAELPAAQRETYVQNELEGMTLQQIADEAGIPLKTVISRKGYAVKHLRVRLAALYNDLNG